MRSAYAASLAIGIFDAFTPYYLHSTTEKIQGDVLCLCEEYDHFMDGQELNKMQLGLVNATSVTTRSYNKEEGGHEHCQTGTLSSVHGDMFAWIAEKFPEAL